MDNRIYEYISNLTSLLQGELIIGDQDSISVYGSVEQQRLGSLAKEITCIFLKQGCDIEITINHILDELKRFHIPQQRKKMQPYKAFPKSVLLNYYNSTLKYIEKLKIEMNLQEAEILKEIDLLERLEKQMEQCSRDLQNCLERGKTLLLRRDSLDRINSADVLYWWERLEQRINDLNLSLIVAKQSLAQISLLKGNDVKIVERIIEITTGAIPLWEGQMQAFTSIANDSNKSILNQKLSEELELLSNIENKDTEIRNELKRIIS